MEVQFRQRLSELVRRYKTDNDIYHDLMQFRVREILLVATIYDAFILEEEDKLTEKIFGEYHQLNLSTAPRITSVSFGEEAIEILKWRSFDMVILTMRIDETSPFELSRRIREANPDIPILLLLNDNTEISLIAEKRDRLAYLDKVFVWNGDSKIFLAMIKYIEDKINAVKDTKIGLVRVILLVEDSIRYYSRYLPLLYTEIMKQTQRIITDEHLVEVKKLLRMRARPKVLMAESYEEAQAIIEEYKDFLLCLITDMKFPLQGKREDQAGAKLIEYVRKRIPDLAILLQSADPEAADNARVLNASYINKLSENLSMELTDFVTGYLGFGDFVFCNRDGEPIGRARSMEEFKDLLFTVPDESLVYHANRNHFSGWLMARGEIQIAKELQPVKVSDFPDTAGLRQHLLEVHEQVQQNQTRGQVVPFDESLLDEVHHVLRLGEGSLGGKGRGMAFLHLMIENCDLNALVSDVNIRIPQTAVIGTQEYDFFVEQNGLREFFTRVDPYQEVKRRFLAGDLSPGLRNKLRRFLKYSDGPLSVRSSGMFEDSLSQPFAGIYDTFLLPNNHPDFSVRLQHLEEAVKLVYASILSESARAYFDAISYKTDEEKMAVLIQQVVGNRHGKYYYPHFSGVAQSYNYYPVAYLKPEDGIAVVGVGLGKYVIDGEKAFRFCPHYPKIDFVSPEEQLEFSQQEFYGIDMMDNRVNLIEGDDATLRRLSIAEAEEQGTLQYCASTWDVQNNRLQVGSDLRGPRVVNFAYVLKYDYFPLAGVLEMVLEFVKGAMGTPVEIEFAADLSPAANGKPNFYILQIKPLLGDLEEYNLDLSEVGKEELVLYSDRAMGNGRVDGLRDVIFVDPERFDKSLTVEMTRELEELNNLLKQENRHYILIGPGRWGSRDPWLGIPVKWNHISNVKIIVEAELPDFKVDPSLGSHFFHNVTSMNIGYFDIPCNSGANFIDWEWLRSYPAAHRSEHFVHLRFDDPLVVKMDGRKRISVILKPSEAPPETDT
ncbi:MAG: phosphoenolpyruvate synthase [Spirochaetaceae bacterium]|nr:MAG: phosphoenolpyruvate synthase [Spirochaetaceae bacterium]